MPRITAQEKAATRQRIVEAACRLFKSQGFEAATTRDIAHEAGIATGTLFNYFPTKEAIVMTLVAEGLQRAEAEFEKQQRAEASLEEDLFLLISTGLRRLKPHRKYLAPAVETALSPLASAAASREAEAVRLRHLELVQQILRRQAAQQEPSAVAIQLYWTLFSGVIAFWVSDPSPQQEDTRALLDQSLRMFVSWLRQGK